MTLLLRESDVTALVTMRDAVEAVERCFSEMRPGETSNSPRTRTIVPGSVLNAMHASLPYLGRGGAKVYSSTRSGGQFIFLLFDLGTGKLLCAMGADMLGRYRTGAASAVATKHMSGLKSFALGMAGTGRQAMTQVTALMEVGSIERVRVWSRDRSHREAFSSQLSRDHGLKSEASDEVEEAVQGADVVTTITASRLPFLAASHIVGVRHVNACGSNWPDRAEITPDGVAAFKTVCVDDLAQSRAESGDLVLAAREGAFRWDRAVELSDVLQSRAALEAPTLFKSNGIAAEDLALASLVYERALQAGVGTDFDPGPA